MKVVSATDMRALDERTIASGIPGEHLMEAAGIGAYEEIMDFVLCLDPRHVGRFIVVTGKGNNGGDGHVVARLLAERTEYAVFVCSVCDRLALKGDALLNADRLPENIEVLVTEDELPAEIFFEGTVFIDCLLGTGIIASYLVLVELWNSDSSKNTDDCNYDQQFYESEA